MKCLGILLIVAIATVQTSLAQVNVTDCTDISASLGITPMDPTKVSDLPVCVDLRGDPQCCSSQFIRQRQAEAEQQFLDGLRIELRERFAVFNAIVDNIKVFIDNGSLIRAAFENNGIGTLDFGGSVQTIVESFLADVKNNRVDFIPGDDGLIANSTDARKILDFVNKLLVSIEVAAVDTLAGQSANVSQCIRQVLESRINVKKMEAQAQAFEQILRVRTTMVAFQSFVQDFTANLGGFRPLQQCIDTVVSLNTCGRCTAVRPPFCTNVCGAIARACYSAFNDALTAQLVQLWDTMKGTLVEAQKALLTLKENKSFFNGTSVLTQISTQCQVDINVPNIPGPRVPRQIDADDFEEFPILPSFIPDAVSALMGGPFDYDPTGSVTEGTGICRLISTTNADCWDGTSVQSDDIDQFDGITIKDQVNNPVIKIPAQNLMDQAISLGTPVTDFVTSPAFAQIAPTGLIIPQTGSNGAATVFITITSLTMMLLASTFVV